MDDSTLTHPSSDPSAITSSRAVVTVLVVDDHALVREGTRELLSQDPSLVVVGAVGSGEEALEAIAAGAPDVALVDVNLPEMSGLELARALHGAHPQVHVLMLSAYDDYAYVAEALDVGVSGYLLKTATTKELCDAVRAVANGIFVLDRQISQRLVRHRQTPAPTQGLLTPREVSVLELLAKGYSNRLIATHMSLGIRTVEGYVSNVLSKLGVASRTEAVAHALRQGLVEVPR
jgi:DNA-binding NarL/FixJ family response regulator